MMRWRHRDERAQATVEAALTLPALIVLAFVVANLAAFVEASFAFEQIARDAVVAHGVSPAGEQTEASGATQVREAIEGSLGREATCSVEVRTEDIGRFGGGATTFAIAPHLTRYVCTLHFRPWPSSFVIAGVGFEPPALLSHECSLVVDRYRPGVVI